MNSIEGVTKIIGLIIAPVVLVTACVLIVNGLIIQYNSIGDRILTVNQKIIKLRSVHINEDDIETQHLPELEVLLLDLFKHHHFVHDAILLIYLSILIFMLDMLVIAIAVTTNINWLALMTLIIFLSGVATAFLGIILISYETSTSHYSIQLEVHHSCHQCRRSRRFLPNRY
ncbi:DUF2721 domain-containing protein (plasmid) [Phormidium sp. CLA17]|uniref:DUF2721 domain-containing protein n=1 Tax=Leptolyngbya sp. Cla-17 TaxID=2803751 RepID=UPI0014924CBB|nr:DUF2721 domain-containing protein [Leptolyngbya sp. Cla-17]MBM0745077.1 DUF2721 domain-containing protein [Leptolyngbya sp. Cla-17]